MVCIFVPPNGSGQSIWADRIQPCADGFRRSAPGTAWLGRELNRRRTDSDGRGKAGDAAEFARKSSFVLPADAPVLRVLDNNTRLRKLLPDCVRAFEVALL